MAETVQKFDYSVDLLQALLWQYTDASRLQKVLERKSDWYAANQRDFWSNWYRDVFDLTTANDFGLAVWARILGVPLVAAVPASGDRPVFGFGEYNLNFNNGNFGVNNSGVQALTTEQKRLVLRLRYFQLISNGSIPQINYFMSLVFGSLGSVYVLDGYDMTMVYVFTFILPASVRFVLENFDILPRPAGVELEILVQPGNAFGYDPYYLNFEQGAFGA